MSHVNEVAKQLRSIREQQGMSLEGLAQKLEQDHGVKFTAAALGHFERGVRRIRLNILEPWCAALGAQLSMEILAQVDETEVEADLDDDATLPEEAA